MQKSFTALVSILCIFYISTLSMNARKNTTIVSKLLKLIENNIILFEENLLKRCGSIVQSTDHLLDVLSEATKKISNCSPELACTDAGLRGQKATRANENFSWNLKLCRAQITQMLTTLNETKEVLSQVISFSSHNQVSYFL